MDAYYKFLEGDFVIHKLNGDVFIVVRKTCNPVFQNVYFCRNKRKDGDWKTEVFYEFELNKQGEGKKTKDEP